ncbi:MAG TPA: 50S ribosomal protein L30 [Acidobacteriota bacterium]|nr:50S ribosomal protein L30 [Acidobacteriota bacterium]
MATKKNKGATIRVQQFRSVIGYDRKQRAVIKGMGFRRREQIVELPDNEASWGMIKKVPHLVRVLEPEGESKGEEKS